MAKNRIIYYKDELNDDFAGNHIKTKQIPDDYPYVNHNIFYRVAAFILYYGIAKPIIWLIMKVMFATKLKNKKVLKKVRGQGYLIYANHTGDILDAFRPNTLRLWRKNYIIVNPDALSIPGIKTIVAMLGALPIVDNNIHQTAKLMEAVEYRLGQKASVTIYPERHIWPYYTKIRPFSPASFHYPVKFDVPVVVLTTTYHRRTGLLRWMKRPKAIHYLDGPFYKDSRLSKAEAKQQLRDEVYQAMTRRASQQKQYDYIQYIKQDDD